MWTPDDKGSRSQGSCVLIEDAILEILLRLPVKSLVQFKCVCKRWYAIVESQSFIEQHFGQRSNKERLLVHHYKHNEDQHAYALSVDDTCSKFEEPAHFQMPDTISRVFGPVNGVFCLVGQFKRKLALLNPATRQLKPLPELPEVIVEPHLHLDGNVLGFGLDPLSENYKVILMQYFLDKRVNPPDYHLIVFIYNLRGDSWRTIEDVGCLKSTYRARRTLCNTYVNGVHYWTMKCITTNAADIIALDMTTEKFEEIPIPDCLKLKLGHLTIHGDSIALLSYEAQGSGCEIWVMQKARSWNRVAVVGPYQVMDWPLRIWKDNELLIAETDTNLLVMRNICTNKRQITQTRWGKGISFLTRVFSYKESLVSIKGKEDNCMQWDASPGVLTSVWAKKD